MNIIPHNLKVDLRKIIFYRKVNAPAINDLVSGDPDFSKIKNKIN
jgi:hypothetical protein